MRDPHAPLTDSGASPHTGLLLTSGLEVAIDLYWMALLSIQNILEDIAGADGRIEYLHSLKYRLVEVLVSMDGVLWPAERDIPLAHKAAFALQHGIRIVGISGPTLRDLLLLSRRDCTFDELACALTRLGDAAIAALPGKLPQAQGSQGQREVLAAMRGWSAAAALIGADIGFLASRFEEL